MLLFDGDFIPTVKKCYNFKNKIVYFFTIFQPLCETAERVRNDIRIAQEFEVRNFETSKRCPDKKITGLDCLYNFFLLLTKASDCKNYHYTFNS